MWKAVAPDSGMVREIRDFHTMFVSPFSGPGIGSSGIYDGERYGTGRCPLATDRVPCVHVNLSV